jgi:DNA-binding NarL/FixJ family response regulator
MSVIDAVPFGSAQTTPAMRAGRSLVGRAVELEAIKSAVEASLESLVGISLEGEPGIGKTTLLGAAAEMCTARGVVPIVAIADEELRGPLLLARTIFSNPDLRANRSPSVVEAIDALERALYGEDDGLARADDRLMRLFDKAATTLRMVAREQPVALLLDDIQWADQDSIRLLRYVIRANTSVPMFLLFTIRPEEMARVTELVTLLADLERLGILQRLHVERLRQTETTGLLRQLLGGDPTLATAATIHAQAEGVPFIVNELTRTYREAGLLQPIGGSWSLARNAERLVPSAVRTLISRRAASLEPATRELLATGAVLGRSFRLADVCAIRAKLGETTACEIGEASEVIAPALAAGLISEGGSEGNRYISFAHEQVRTFALETLSSARRRQLHSAVVDMLADGGDPSPETLPAIVRHAVAAGDTARIARYSLDAARSALAANAPEEALRLIEEALGVVSDPAQRAEILRTRDNALDALGRSAERLQQIAELLALVEAGGDEAQQFDAQLRRAAALRGDGRHDAAAEVARKVRARAAAAGKLDTELGACLELGQDLLRSTLGEGYTPTANEADFDAAEEAFARAAEIAEQTAAEPSLAAALRELGAIKLARIREWFVARIQAGDHIPYVIRIANGERLDEIEKELPISGLVAEAEALLTRSLELFEKLGDRRGTMSAILSLAYLQWAPELHLGTSPARRFEGIRQLVNTVTTLSQESEREASDAQMLYGVHVFARSKLIPDLAVQRGEEAYERARALGDVALEFLAALGQARALLELGDPDGAQRWFARAADAATSAPTPHRARQLAIGQALLAAARGDAEQMRSGLQDVARMAAAQRRPAAQCEALALMALETARAGAANADESMLSTAESAAAETRRLCAELAGHPLWAAQAAAAASQVALARGDQQKAVELARVALTERHAAMREDPHLEILVPAARAIMAGGDEAEKQLVYGELRVIQQLILQRTLDDDVRVQWFRGPVGSELAELVGPMDMSGPAALVRGERTFSADEGRLLQLLTAGRTNREIAGELGIDEAAVMKRLTALYAEIGADSRAQATAFAFRARV